VTWRSKRPIRKTLLGVPQGGRKQRYLHIEADFIRFEGWQVVVGKLLQVHVKITVIAHARS